MTNNDYQDTIEITKSSLNANKEETITSNEINSNFDENEIEDNYQFGRSNAIFKNDKLTE